MKKLLKSREIQGEMIMFGETFIWALFPIFVLLMASNIPILFSAGISTLFAAVFFGIIIVVRKEWRDMQLKKAFKYIMYVTFLLGILFYVMVFIGIEQTSAGNASIILLMEVFFTMLILGLWKKEKQTVKSVGGGFLMVLGAFLVMFQGGFVLNQGDLIILLAVAIPPIGNYFAKQARKYVSASMMLFIRSLIAGIVILVIAYMVEIPPTFEQLRQSFWILFITGFLILGLSKIFWIEAIHRITITKAITLSAYAPAFTLIFAYYILGDVPTIWQILGFIPMVAGIYLISEIRNFKKQSNI